MNIEEMTNSLPALISVTVGLTVTIVTIVTIVQLVFARYASSRLPRAYSIAVIGYPRSGKTFLITAIFGELFSERLSELKTIPRGKETIERINRDLENLEIGRSLGPTTDQDRFAYRTDVEKGGGPFKRRYKVEIGDFPGENTVEFAEQFGDWLHETPYFKWVMDADCFLFVIDVLPLLDPEGKSEYIAKTSRAIRAAWHHLLEYHTEGKKNLKLKPLCLVFTKADLLMVDKETNRPAETNERAREQSRYEELKKLGLEKVVPIDLDRKPLELPAGVMNGITSDYSGLLGYLKGQSSKFSIQFVSSIANSRKGRFGVRETINSTFPLY